MFRLALAGAGVAVLCAAAYFLSWSLASSWLPGVDLMPLLSAIALIVSLVAVAAALRAVRHVARLRNDIHLLARSIDVALKDVAARTDKETATISEMTTSVAREIDRLSERVAQREGTADDAQADNVIPHPSARRNRGTATAEQTLAAPEASSIEAAYRKAVAAGAFDISLQPVVSVSSSTASGFEVFASLPLEGGRRVDLRRPADPTARTEAASFERILLSSALHAGRERLGPASADMPLHVAISDALLADGREHGAVLDMLQFYPDLAKSFVLSIPAAILDQPTYAQALDMLADKGVRFAAEGWDEAGNAGDPFRIGGLSFVKISANRLLDRERVRRKLAPASTIVERATAANVTIVATDVANDEDAVSLIDLGVDLMSGPRFGEPRRLKPEDGGNRPGRLALI
jgi:cyclic-di-GMP phosphodiesterase TipF (flagellum assembly factor)